MSYKSGKSERTIVGACAMHDGTNRCVTVNRNGKVVEYRFFPSTNKIGKWVLYDPKEPSGVCQATTEVGGKRVNIYRAIALASYGDADLMDEETYRALYRAIFNTVTVIDRKDSIYSYRRSRFDVHHVDGNHDNNKASNLVLVTTSDHRHLHDLLSACGKAFISGNEKDAKYYRRVYRDLVKKARSIDYVLGETRLF